MQIEKGAAGKGDGTAPREFLKWTNPPCRRVHKFDLFQPDRYGGSFAAGIWPFLWNGPACLVLTALPLRDTAWSHHILAERYFIFSDLVRASSPAAITSSVVISEMGV